MKIAIGFDKIEKADPANSQSYSNIWEKHCRSRGIEAKILDPMKPGFISKVKNYDAFIWRYGFVAPTNDAAPRLLRAVEDDLEMPVWPPRRLRDVFENKISQSYLLDSLNIPHPKTWVFWERNSALSALDTLTYPLVAKLSQGVQSNGVRLIQNKAEAETLINRLFSFGLGTMDYDSSFLKRLMGKYIVPVTQIRRGGVTGRIERGYLLLQEFLENNDYDHRLVIQGDRIFASRRKNREGDFRASGSNNPDLDPANIAPETIELGFRVADAMGVKSIVLDTMFRGDEPVVTEMAYTMAIAPTRNWDHHWVRTENGIEFRDETFDWPVQILDDFIDEVSVKHGLKDKLAQRDVDNNALERRHQERAPAELVESQ